MDSTTKPENSECGEDFARLAAEAYSAGLHRFLLSRLRGEEDVRDVMQETFLRIVRIERAQLVGRPQPYIYRIALRVLRARGLAAERERLTASPPAPDELAGDPASISQDEMAEKLSGQRLLERAVCRLPRRHQDVLLLHLNGEPDASIARKLSLSEQNVKKYIMQAKAQIRSNCGPSASLKD